MAEEALKPIQGEQAWASASVWSGAWEKYNPDTLIGRRGFAIYKRMMLDEQVKAVVNFKRDAITTRDWYWEFDEVAEEELSDDEKDFRKRLCTKIVQNIKGRFSDKLNGVLSSTYNGFSLTEKIPVQFEFEGKTYWGMKDLKLRPFDTFTFHVDQYDNVKKVVQSVGAQENTINLRKFIHMVNQPEVDPHYGQSELREAYRPWFSKDKAILFYNIFLERAAQGFKVVKPMPGHTFQLGSPEYTQLQSVLDNTTAGNGMILPGKAEFEIHWPTGTPAYPEAIDKYDLHIARSLLMPNLLGITPSGQTGSYSQSDTHWEAFQVVLDSDAGRLEEVLNEDLFRELGEINFGDDYWPRIKFKQLNDRKKMEVVDRWKELIREKAVKATEKDEAHVRNILDFPQRTEEDELLYDPADSIDPNNPGVPGNVPGGVRSSPGDTGKPGKTGTSDDDTKGQVQEETLNRGKLVQLYGVDGIERAISKAEKRVAFAVIANTTNSMEAEQARTVGLHLFEATERAYAETDLDRANFKYSSGDKSKMNRIVSGILGDAWNVGMRHATMEVDKAKGTTFTTKQDFTAVEKDYIKLRSLKATGNMMDDAQAIVENVILQGIKAGKSRAEIRLDIYSAFRSSGLLAEEIEQALGEALAGRAAATQVVNSQARIETFLRTNIYEALNEARFNYFQSPELGGFVEALQYSAIIDSRTTSICKHLDGTTHAANSEVWNNYRPPNHYNCRSLLIPVVQGDAWTEDKPPEQAPQRGFE